MLSSRGLALAALVSVSGPILGGMGCAHRPGAAALLTEPAKRLAAEASRVRAIAFEEDFMDARLIYRALPAEAVERNALRRQLIQYLLGPLSTIDARAFRARMGDLGASDDLDRILASFSDALDLYSAAELWNPQGPLIPVDERALLKQSALLVTTLFG